MNFRKYYSIFCCLLLGIPLLGVAQDLTVNIPVIGQKKDPAYAYESPLCNEPAPLLENSLRSVPSLYVQQQGGDGQLATVNFRGLSAYNTAVLADNIPLNTTGSGMFDFSHLLSGSFSQIKLIASPSPILYGPGSAGGVVSMTTDAGQDQVKIEAGSFDSVYGYGRKFFQHKNHGVTLHVEGFGTQGLPEYGPYRMLGEKAPYNNQTVAARYDYRTSKIKLKGTLRGMQDYGKYDETSTNLGPKPQGRQTTQTMMGNIELIYDSSAQKSHQLNTYFNVNKSKFSQESFSDVLLGGIDYAGQHEWNSRQKTLVKILGNKTQLKKELGFAKSQNHLAAGVQHTVFITPAVFVTGGARNDHYDHTKELQTYEGTTGYLYDKGVLKVSLRTGVRPPTIYDFYMDNFYVQSNRNLQVEKTQTADITWEHRVNDRAVFKVSPYITQAHNLITNTLVGGKFTTVNAFGTTQISGFDIMGDLTLTDKWKLRPAYTYTQTNYKNVILSPSFPKHKGSLDTLYDVREDLQLTGALLMVGAYDSLGHSIKPIQLVDLGVSYYFSAAHKTYFRIDNFFDTHYQQVYGYRSPGRAIYGGLHCYF
ncbi:MAG: TonB-dependent receptor plug domain-containing protein [Alphaproteobacteria bacterium]